ncbi:MAG: hypothetical protein ACWGOW_05245, partial [Gammaproteobacteria bacterium]
MSTDNPRDSRHSAPEEDTEAGDITDAEPTRRLRWVRRVLTAIFIVLVAVLAIRELRGFDVHALRAVLQAVTLPQLLLIQLIAIVGLLSMTLYDWHAARVFKLGIPLPTLLRNAWIANAFNNLIGLSGLAGSGIRMLLLGSERIDVQRAAAYAGLILASVPVGLAVLSWPLLWRGEMAMDSLPIPVWTAWLALGAFAAYLPVYVLALYKGMFSRLLRGLTPQSGTSLALLIAISTLDWLLAAIVAWVALDVSGAAIP